MEDSVLMLLLTVVCKDFFLLVFWGGVQGLGSLRWCRVGAEATEAWAWAAGFGLEAFSGWRWTVFGSGVGVFGGGGGGGGVIQGSPSWGVGHFNNLTAPLG